MSNKKRNVKSDGFSSTSTNDFSNVMFNKKIGGAITTEPIFVAIRNGDFATPYSSIVSGKIDLSETNEEGDTLLHLLIKLYDTYRGNQNFIKLFNIIVNKADGKIINIRNKDGNTALHLAVIGNLHQLVDNLIKQGGDKTIRNNEGLKVETATMTDAGNKLISISSLSIPALSDILSSEPRQIISSVKEKLKSKIDTLDPNLVVSAAKNAYARVPDMVSSAKGYMTKVFSKPPQPATPELVSMSSMGLSPIEQTPVEPPVNISGMAETVPTTGGGNKTDLMDTEQFISSLLKTYNKPKVGGRKIVGQRHMNRLSNGFKKRNDDESSQGESASQISRLLKNQSDIIHERVIEKIMELMNVSKEVARDYKAAIYRMVKEKFSNLSNLDRAIEMEKLATKEILDTVDIEKVSSEIKQHLEERRREKELSESSSEPSFEKKKSKRTAKSSSKTSEKKPRKKKESSSSGGFSDDDNLLDDEDNYNPVESETSPATVPPDEGDSSTSD